MLIRVLLTLLLLWLPGDTHAHWSIQLFKLIDEAGDVANAGKTAGRWNHSKLLHTFDTLKQHPLSHLLLERDNTLYLVNDKLEELPIGTLKSSGDLLWVDDISTVVSSRDILLPMEMAEQHAELVAQLYRFGPDSLRMVRPDGSLARVRGGTGVGEVVEVEILPDIYATTDLIVCCNLDEILSMPLDRLRLRVLSLLDDSDAGELRALDEATGEWHVSLGGEPEDVVLQSIRQRSRDTIFLVGHIEAEHIVVRDASGRVRQSYAISALESAVQESDSSLVILGCGAAACSRSAGFAGDVNALDVAQGIRASLNGSSLGEALSLLARHGGEMVLNEGTVDALRAKLYFSQLRVGSVQDPGAAPVISVATVSPLRAAELSARIVPGIPSILQYLYLLGFVVALLGARRSVTYWRSAWKPAPKFDRSPLVFIGIYALRLIGYVLLMPLSALLAFSICTILWSSVAFTLILSLPVFVISAWSGKRWYSSHCDDVSSQAWYLKWLAIPAMCLLISLPVALIAIPFSIQLDQTNTTGWWGFLVHWFISGALALLLARRVERWVSSRNWIPARGIVAIWYFPLRLIDTLTNQLWWNQNVTRAH